MADNKITQAVEAYFSHLRLVQTSGGATDEKSLYVPLANLLNAVGRTLRPKVFCVQELADQGVGHPDFGLYTTQQVQKGKPKSGQKPERGVIEVKPVAADAWLTAESDQVAGYWQGYRQVLVTNARDFVLVGEDDVGQPVRLESLRLADSASQFDAKLEHPRAFANEVGPRLGRVPDPRAVPCRFAGRTQGRGVAAGILRPRRAGSGGKVRRCHIADNIARGAGRIVGHEV